MKRLRSIYRSTLGEGPYSTLMEQRTLSSKQLLDKSGTTGPNRATAMQRSLKVQKLSKTSEFLRRLEQLNGTAQCSMK
ncbi:hypothetical protein PROFUN_16367 [Planoprotostelium fungivorum]|uniref:Uncharacterized protein n=1 Tax=Planoprotostelium fungivorum TaxID=1890364 RepID=A0A2P6MR78_9EUKA|nr:hypothetical protein PROFUN_16367 [Planoprotostelium fungivorum]